MKRLLSLLLFLIFTASFTLILLYIVQIYGGVGLSMPGRLGEVLSIVSEHNEVGGKHKAVDLGLSVKWATCNVGADSPEEYGDYYAWGETEEKSVYSSSNYMWYGGNGLTKYCISREYGIVDERWTLELTDDVAHAQWGNGWRMPTSDELGELKDRCSWKWTSVNGVYGYKVIGPNGKSIFLPAAGSRCGGDISGHGLRGRYWSSTVCGGYDDRACYLLYDSNRPDRDYLSRESGLSVRPVRD